MNVLPMDTIICLTTMRKMSTTALQLPWPWLVSQKRSYPYNQHQHDGWESLRPSPIDPGLGVEGAKATASMVCLGAAFRVATSICVGWNRLWGDNGGARKGLCGLAEERRYHHKHP
ncbi:hypothetical protein D9611_013944 [Ephemerocybe angulata]|uniref:Uncharacterized protein n=1 Tax=Ephemerocybe angulata TaxID=980116 RepID=A0A8H5ARL9_9AGAR|nr:hypothetical protein D9611_013944 [Tulosesus angulatus]